MTAKGMTPTDEKLRAVKQWETPKEVKDVRFRPRICQLLSAFCTSLHRNSPSINSIDKEGCGMAMGTDGTTGVSQLEAATM